MRNILLLEDDQNFGYILKAYLELNEMNVTWVKEGQKALTAVEEFPFDLCILDIMLPDIDGFAVADRINDINAQIPFIFLTAKSLKVDKLKGYKLGCDDYITKPVDEEILLAKIYAILNRSNRTSNPVIDDQIYVIGSYRFNFKLQQLCHAEDVQKLTNKEAKLLKLFCDNTNQLVGRDGALKFLWGKNDEFNRRTMDVFVFKLRKYLKSDEKVRITNVHGRGFVLEVKVE